MSSCLFSLVFGGENVGEKLAQLLQSGSKIVLDDTSSLCSTNTDLNPPNYIVMCFKPGVTIPHHECISITSALDTLKWSISHSKKIVVIPENMKEEVSKAIEDYKSKTIIELPKSCKGFCWNLVFCEDSTLSRIFPQRKLCEDMGKKNQLSLPQYLFDLPHQGRLKNMCDLNKYDEK
jgi:hypothetical protein